MKTLNMKEMKRKMMLMMIWMTKNNTLTVALEDNKLKKDSINEMKSKKLMKRQRQETSAPEEPDVIPTEGDSF
jgi:hypothetical protein